MLLNSWNIQLLRKYENLKLKIIKVPLRDKLMLVILLDYFMKSFHAIVSHGLLDIQFLHSNVSVSLSLSLSLSLSIYIYIYCLVVDLTVF